MNSSQGSVHPSQARMRTVLLALGVFFLSGQILIHWVPDRVGMEKRLPKFSIWPEFKPSCCRRIIIKIIKL